MASPGGVKGTGINDDFCKGLFKLFGNFARDSPRRDKSILTC